MSLEKLEAYLLHVEKTHPVNTGANSLGKIDYLDGLPSLTELFRLYMH